MKVSEQIRQRILDAGARFHSNDNIAQYIQEGELDSLVDEVAEHFEKVL